MKPQMVRTRTHMALTYYLPRFMGGDVLQPLCRAPKNGWVPQYAQWPMTEKLSAVDCPWCLARLPKMALAA